MCKCKHPDFPDIEFPEGSDLTKLSKEACDAFRWLDLTMAFDPAEECVDTKCFELYMHGWELGENIETYTNYKHDDTSRLFKNWADFLDNFEKNIVPMYARAGQGKTLMPYQHTKDGKTIVTIPWFHEKTYKNGGEEVDNFYAFKFAFEKDSTKFGCVDMFVVSPDLSKWTGEE